MKNIRILFTFLVFSFIVSCDKELYYDYVIENESNQPILVNMVFHNDNVRDTLISVQARIILTTSKGYGNSVNEFEISRLFKDLTIRNADSVFANKDYLSNEYWLYKEYSDTHAEFLLTIYSAHFQK
jgi:hypothetical protein